MPKIIWLAVADLDGNLLEDSPVKCIYNNATSSWFGQGKHDNLEIDLIGEIIGDKTYFSSIDKEEVLSWIEEQKLTSVVE